MICVHNSSFIFLSSIHLINPKKHHHHHHHLSFSSPNLTTFPRSKNVIAVNFSFGKNSSSSISVDQNIPSQTQPLMSASNVVKNFYGGINRHDLAAVEPLIADNCVYEDLIFSEPFIGRKSILEFFSKFIDYVSTDLQFVIDAISEEDSAVVGVTWHLEWKGRPFPFSKGCSFYQLQLVNGIRQIIYARDSVEPAFKPGESALIAIRGVTWLLQRFPKLAERL